MEHNLQTDGLDILERLRAYDPDVDGTQLIEDARLEIAGLRGENASLRRQLFGGQAS